MLFPASLFKIAMAVVLAISPLRVRSLASYMIQDYFCDRNISVGTYIMNHEALLDDDNTVIVTRGVTELSSGDPYILGEELTIRFSNSALLKQGIQVCFESNGAAAFSGPKSGCNDGERSRSYEDSPTLTMPADASAAGVVKVHAGWAVGYKFVYVTEPFVLNPPPSGGSEL
jgi:hypothetical protein